MLFAVSVITAQPLVDEDVLEPSVQNEVDHAVSLAPTNCAALGCAAVAFAELYATNGLSATDRAVALVSAQKGGRWFYDGADVTPVAVRMLLLVSGCGPQAAEPMLTAAEVWRLAERDGSSFAAAALKAEKLGFRAQGGPSCAGGGLP